MLLERLLEVEAALLLLELRQAGGVVRRGRVCGKECVRHHLQPRVDESCRLRDERTEPARTREASRLRGERGHARGAAHETVDWLLRTEEATGLNILLRLLLEL